MPLVGYISRYFTNENLASMFASSQQAISVTFIPKIAPSVSEIIKILLQKYLIIFQFNYLKISNYEFYSQTNRQKKTSGNLTKKRNIFVFKD